MALHFSGLLLHFATTDRLVVLEAAAGLKSYSGALGFASDAIKGDREVVHLAVQRHGLALRYAAPELRDDEQIVMSAVKQTGASDSV